jgi:sulfite exporter TauE/SafE
MLSFGAGTLPAVMIASILTGWFTRLIRTSYIRPIIGLIIIIMALITGYLALLHSTHQPLSENNVNNDHQHHIKN